MGKVVTLGELMLRLSPTDHKRFVQADCFCAEYGGAEANVAAGLAVLGEDAYFISKLPKHEIGQAAVNALRRYGVNTSLVLRGGTRVGLYYLEKGSSQRADKVIYDRAMSAFAESEASEYDWDVIFEGARWFHFTGITPALSANALDISLKACQEAKKRNITVSFDVNYRKALWDIGMASNVIGKILSYVDVCVVNENQASELFRIDSLEDEAIAEALIEKFHLKLVALTYRRTINADRNIIWASLYDGEKFVSSAKYEIDMVDRVGGGDAFAAGLIYALMHGYDLQKSVSFASAASCLEHSVAGDMCLVTFDEIEALRVGETHGRLIR